MEGGGNGGRLILVSGATGQQGGAVARSLLERGFGVRALTRDPEKSAGKELAGLGAEVASGDLEDRESIERVLDGVHGVFSVQQFFEAGYEGEVRQGVQLADAAKAAGVDHYVYSSVGSAHRETGILHFESKWEVEEHVRASGVPYTVLRPVYFMQNWEMMREPILGGTLPQPLDPDKPFQMIDADDIGVFAAMAFENLDEWVGREVDHARDSRYIRAGGRTPGRLLPGTLGPVRGADGRGVHRHVQVVQRLRLRSRHRRPEEGASWARLLRAVSPRPRLGERRSRPGQRVAVRWER